MLVNMIVFLLILIGSFLFSVVWLKDLSFKEWLNAPGKTIILTLIVIASLFIIRYVFTDKWLFFE